MEGIKLLMASKFIFICLTPYQLFMSYSYIIQLRKYTNLNCVLVYVQGINSIEINKNLFEDVEIIVIPELFSNPIKRYWKRLYFGGRLFKFSKLYNIVTENTTLIIFNDTEPITSKMMKETKRRNKLNGIILVEEGLGLYNFIHNKKDNKVAVLKFLLTKLIGNEIKFQSIGLSEEIDTIIAREPKNLPLSKSKNKLILKQSVFKLFDPTIVENFIKTFIDTSTLNSINRNNTILYIDQPISEYIDPNNSMKNEVAFMIEIFNNLPNNTNIVIKPHPRDNNAKYELLKRKFKNIIVLEGSIAMIPIECILSLFRNATILTYSSSAGVNGKYIYSGIRVCFMFKVFIDYINKHYEGNHNIINKLMGKNCIVANDFKDISSYINKGFKLKENIEIDNEFTSSEYEDIFYLRNFM